MILSLTKKQQKQFIMIFCREIQNTRQWSEFKDQYRLLYSFYYAIRMGGKFSQELSMICMSILTISAILKLLAYKQTSCKIQMVILDLYFAIVSLTIMMMFVFPSLPQTNQQLDFTQNFQGIGGDSFILEGPYRRRGSLTPIAATFSNQIDSYIQLNDVLFVYYRPILLVHVLLQFIIIQHFTSIYSGYLLWEHLVAGFQLTFAILIQMQIDISLQYSDECSRRKDIQVMKTIHDLKNPVIAISQTLNEEDYDTLHKDKIKTIINTELTELEDMLESLRTEFKSRHQMEIKETPHEVDSLEFATQFKRAFKKLTQNGGNSLKIVSEDAFPLMICIQKSNVKRIVNNLISNALKHTMDGHVRVHFSIKEKSEIKSLVNQNDPDMQMEPKNFKVDQSLEISNQVLVEVMDNGSGIEKDKLPQIFSEKFSDESETNWDGTGLGLPICSYICTKMNAFIIYSSTPKSSTLFKFQIPNYHSHKISTVRTSSTHNNNVISRISINLNVKIIDRTSKDQDHFCNCAYFAEDNPNILSKYEKILQKRKIPYKTFENGRLLLNYIKNMSCTSCIEILVYTDLNMPYMDGKQLAKELRNVEKEGRYFKKIKVVLISAEEFDNSENLFDEVFYKPIIPSKLVNIYSEFFNVNTKKLPSNEKILPIHKIMSKDCSIINSKSELSTNLINKN